MRWLIEYSVIAPLYYYFCIYPFLKVAKKADKVHYHDR